jgi:hypothetical protein
MEKKTKSNQKNEGRFENKKQSKWYIYFLARGREKEEG